MRRGLAVLGCALATIAACGGVARADFPWNPGAANPVPNDLAGDGNDWKFAATPEPSTGNPAFDAQNAEVQARQSELCGVRGAAVGDPLTSISQGCASGHGVHTAWQVTRGRPDVSIAVLDSGVKWNDAGAMNESPTRSGTTMQFGQPPAWPPLLASELESLASPVPWPYWTSS